MRYEHDADLSRRPLFERHLITAFAEAAMLHRRLELIDLRGLPADRRGDVVSGRKQATDVMMRLLRELRRPLRGPL